MISSDTSNTGSSATSSPETDATAAITVEPLRGATVVLMHALLGPPLGLLGLVLLALDAIVRGRQLDLGGALSGLSPGVVADVLQMTLFLVLMSYVAGGLQALMCGLWLGWRTRRHGRYGYLEATIAALSAALVFALLVRWWQGGIGDPLHIQVLGWAVPSVFAALTLRFAFTRLGWIKRRGAGR